jgi:hypothetical protein
MALWRRNLCSGLLVESAMDHAVRLVDNGEVTMNDAARLVRVQKRHLSFELVRIPDIVSIQIGDELTNCPGNGQIPGGCRSPVSLAHMSDTLPVSSDDLLRVIGRAIIRHDDFVVRIRLRENASESLPDESAAVEGGNDD